MLNFVCFLFCKCLSGRTRDDGGETRVEAEEVARLRDCMRIRTGNVNLQSVQLAQAGCLVSDAENIRLQNNPPRLMNERQATFISLYQVCM